MSGDVETKLRGPEAYALARKALATMEKHQVWPTAINFELWTHVVADPEGPLAREITRLISTGEPFTDGLSDELAAVFLPKARLNEQIRDAGDALSKELISVSQAIQSAQKSSEAYGQTLAHASKSLTSPDQLDVKATAETLVARPRDPSDNASPSGLSSLVHALIAHSALTGAGHTREAAEAALRSVGMLAEKAPRFAGWSLAAAVALLDGPREIAVVGPAGEDRDALERRARRIPGAVGPVGIASTGA